MEGKAEMDPKKWHKKISRFYLEIDGRSDFGPTTLAICPGAEPPRCNYASEDILGGGGCRTVDAGKRDRVDAACALVTFDSCSIAE